MILMENFVIIRKYILTDVYMATLLPFKSNKSYESEVMYKCINRKGKRCRVRFTFSKKNFSLRRHYMHDMRGGNLGGNYIQCRIRKTCNVYLEIWNLKGNTVKSKKTNLIYCNILVEIPSIFYL
jgi:hypothetical protein